MRLKRFVYSALFNLRAYLLPPSWQVEDHSVVSGMLNAMLLATVGIGIVTTLLLLGLRIANGVVVMIMFVSYALMLGVRYWLWHGHARLVAVICTVGILAINSLTLYALGTIRNVILSIYFIGIVFATLVLGSREGLVFLLASSLVLFGLTQMEMAGLMPMISPPAPLNQWVNFTAVATVMLVVAVVARTTILRLVSSTRRELAERQVAEAAIRQLNATLETRVEERTVELENQVKVRESAELALRRQNQYLGALHEITLDLLNYHDLDNLLRRIAERAATFMDAPHSLISLAEGEWLVDRVFVPPDAPYVKKATRHGESGSPIRHVFERCEPFVTDNYSALTTIREETAALGLRAALLLPITIGKNCLGVMAMARTRPDYPFDAEDVRAGMMFVRLVALALDSARLRDNLHEQSIRDPLTGLFNRRYMEESLAREVQRAERTRQPLALVMIDLDYFKNFNDAHGHLAGDVALRELATLLELRIRRSDIACRYGGEEFVLILPDASAEQAQHRIEQLRELFHTLDLKHEESERGQLTLSAGIADYSERHSTAEKMLRAADYALYRAKANGRNCVVVA